MSTDNDPIIRVSDLRKVLEAMRTWHDKALKDPGCVVEAKIAGVVASNAICEALAALPQREAAHAGPCNDASCPDSRSYGHVHPKPAAPHEGEPPYVDKAPYNSYVAALKYARHQRERADTAVQDAARIASERACEMVERRKAEAELAKLREQEPVVGEKFVRGWLSIAELPGGMMVSNGGRFGPVPAFTGCGVTTSEETAAEWREQGKPALEVWTAPVPPADHALREAREEVWREAAREADRWDYPGFADYCRDNAAKAREVKA